MNNNHNIIKLLGLKVAKRYYNNLKHPIIGDVIENHYIGPLCNNNNDELCPNDDVVEEKMSLV
jgi:hypothetical protein